MKAANWCSKETTLGLFIKEKIFRVGADDDRKFLEREQVGLAAQIFDQN